jgi:decaprenylphospho-beta-D-erythro-pentofuranosid-2-ulose 2-reductase
LRVAFLGATRGIGRALARELAERGHRLFLLGRDGEQLARSVADLEARVAGSTAGWAPLDLAEVARFGPALDAADAAFRGTPSGGAADGLDALVITAAEFAPQETLEQDAERLRRLLDADFTATVLLCEAARPRLLQRRGTLAVFGSVAGDRARGSIVLYGAAKAGLAHYLEGLDHRFHAQGLRVVTAKPGFVRTAMTQGLPEPPFAADPEPVARRVAAAIERGRPVVYAPGIWWLVMSVIRRLPRAVMRRIGF